MFDKEYFYTKATDMEKLCFNNIISALIDVILSMVRNGAVVLPSDLSKNCKQSIYKHIEIATMDKHTAFQRYKYDNVMSLKRIILECIPNKNNTTFLNRAVKHIKIFNGNSKQNQKIKFVFHKDIINAINSQERQNLVKDVLYFEKVINYHNKRLVKMLPQALIEREKIMKMMIKKTPVPKNAIYIDKDVSFLNKSL